MIAGALVRLAALAVALTALSGPGSGTDDLDERPAGPGEWGFRPPPGSVVERTPPAFSWRPQAGAATYELQASRDLSFARIDYAASGIAWTVYCPARAFEPGAWAWRFRAIDAEGEHTSWSTTRAFEVPQGAHEFVLPEREDLLARIPTEHPRLFVRPEDMPRLVELADGPLGRQLEALTKRCDALLADPPPTEEPRRYPEGPEKLERGSDPWREIWWGNRKYTIRVLESASTLAFTWRLTGREEYGQLARRLLLDAARWDPRGATGYRYNDEAGMPYAYHFSRTYTFVHPLLEEEERATCRKVMRARGREMYEHLAPRHLWKPYSSHSNRAWHFLGEVGIAFHGEIPEADDWVWFAANVFANVYPVWSDADGGWHEGTSYWRSYLSRFTWWADVQRAALGLDAYTLPFFARAGDWALYLMPPGTQGGGFGDLNAARKSKDNRELMTVFAAQAGSPTWQWYVEQLGGPAPGGGWIGFLRSALPKVKARPPNDLATSRLFRGTGIAVLQSSLTSAADNVSVIFKSSPFGTQSHGYESQNSFLLYAFGERLLIRSGYRDSYGSQHHRKWMWQTKSTNSITVGGQGQTPHSASARGRITGFLTLPGAHFVEGEAAEAYGGRLETFRRQILFLEPDLIVIHDRLRAKDPSTFEWRLHAPAPFVHDPDQNGLFTTENGAAACLVSFITPADLAFQQTDRFDTPPRERVQLVQHHLTAATDASERERTFVTVIRPYRSGSEAPPSPRMERDGDSHRITSPVGTCEAALLLGPEGIRRAVVVDEDGSVVTALDTAPARLEH